MLNRAEKNFNVWFSWIHLLLQCLTVSCPFKFIECFFSSSSNSRSKMKTCLQKRNFHFHFLIWRWKKRRNYRSNSSIHCFLSRVLHFRVYIFVLASVQLRLTEVAVQAFYTFWFIWFVLQSFWYGDCLSISLELNLNLCKLHWFHWDSILSLFRLQSTATRALWTRFWFRKKNLSCARNGDRSPQVTVL